MSESDSRISIIVALLICWGCGGGSTPRTPTTPPPPVPSLVTTGRVVTGLNLDQGVSGAVVEGVGLAPAIADGSGQFTVRSSSATGPLSLRVTSPSIVERRVFLRVPGDPVTVSTMPTSIDLSYFNEMCRNTFSSIARWTSAPVLLVETSAIEYVSRVSTGEAVPADVVQRTIAELRQVLPILSAGRFTDFAAIEMRQTPAGAQSMLIDGAIGLTWQTHLLERFTHVAYGARVHGGQGTGLIRGEVALDRDWHVHGLPAGSRRDFFNVVQHELGHAMGFGHTRFSPSFMYEVFLMTISAIDRQAFEIVMQRPNGNTSPDNDPIGTSLNVTTGSRQTVVERCDFLRVTRAP